MGTELVKPTYSVDALAVAVGACGNNEFAFPVDWLIQDAVVTEFVVNWEWQHGASGVHESWSIVGVTVEKVAAAPDAQGGG